MSAAGLSARRHLPTAARTLTLPHRALAALEGALRAAGLAPPTRVTAQTAGLARVALAELGVTVLLGTVLAGAQTLRRLEKETGGRGQRLLIIASNRRYDLPLELPIVLWDRGEHGAEVQTRGFHCKRVEVAELLRALSEDRFTFATEIPALPVRCRIDLYTQRCHDCLAWTLVWCAQETTITDCRLITALRSDSHNLWGNDRPGVNPAVHQAVTKHLRQAGWAGTFPVIALRYVPEPDGVYKSFCCGSCGALLDSAYICRNAQHAISSETIEVTVGNADAQRCPHWCYVERGRKTCAETEQRS